MSMFCYQCEQTSGGTGCTRMGVCGKDPQVAALQDVLVYALKGLAVWGNFARKEGITNEKLDAFLLEGLFTTVTNVNFEPSRLAKIIRKAVTLREQVKKRFLQVYQENHQTEYSGIIPAEALWEAQATMDGLISQGLLVGVMSDPDMQEDIRSLRELFLYGLKGMASYADHSLVLGYKDDSVTEFIYKALVSLTDKSLTLEDWIGLNMELGKVNLTCMGLLDTANTKRYGHPVPTPVFLGAKKGPAIVVSGHDLKDLEELLKQSEGKGVSIYTHGEMLPAHGYPELKKYPHLVGNYGGAWQDQAKEFNAFPGCILMTTNCIQKPKDSYKDRIFTTGLVAWPDVTHIAAQNGHKDFTKMIEKAIALGGYPEDVEGKSILVGFGHHTVLGIADQVIGAVKAGKIRRFFLVGGCDGAKSGRNYYTELAEKIPQDCVIMTLACGKYRFNKMEFGDINGIPRLLDIGQCNDAYSAIQIAVALANAFECGVNDLPLSMILSWYEQKAVCILLTLLSLGIKDIRLGPTLPAFITPNVLQVLVENFNIKPITTVDADLKAILG